MNDQASLPIRADVDRGLQIVGELKMLQEELDAIEVRLEAAGLGGDQVELNDPEREGRQFLARGSAATVPVVFTADLLVQSFQDASAVHEKMRAAFIGELSLWDRTKLLKNFYVPKLTWVTLFDSGKKFRAHAAELLGNNAPPFISACLQRDKEGIPKSKVKIDWTRAEPLASPAHARDRAPDRSEAAS